MKILLAEDDKFYSQMIKELLSDQGIDVVCVESAQDALARYNRSYYAVILDSMLPNDPIASGLSERETRGGHRSGICVARKLKQKHSSVRIVILSADPASTGANEWCAKSNAPCVWKSDGQLALLGALERIGVGSRHNTPSSFIVHGHDEGVLQELKGYIKESLRWQAPIILREQPSLGRTIIEKFEFNAHRVDCVFVLLTPDDVPIESSSSDAKRRSRQNVIFELGFFYAHFKRLSGRVFLFYKGKVELPSDLHGIVWIDITLGIAGADSEIKAELTAANLMPDNSKGSALDDERLGGPAKRVRQKLAAGARAAGINR